MRVIDDGAAIHYTAVARGTPVYAADGTEVGTVDQVVDNYREHILDGIVVETKDRRPALRRRAGGQPHRRAGGYADDRRRGSRVAAAAGERRGHFQRQCPTGRLGRLFGRGWKRD